MTAQSIGAAKGGGYARYLESKTVTLERGDYYLTPDGEPIQAPGRWLVSPETRERLGIAGGPVDGPDFIALMEGRHPRSGEWLRPAGAGGARGGGIDLTFSAPKSVSTVWALGTPEQRVEMESAHAAAVAEAMGYLTETVPTVRSRHGDEVLEEHARELISAEYRHTTSRGVLEGDVPDPQLHSHVVVTSAVREDGRIAAVASRPVFRSAREVGAYYRAALAEELSDRGYAIEAGLGKHGRYFEIAGVPRGLLDAFSARTREVARAAERFRAKWGRAPERGELRALKLENRRGKAPATRDHLQRVWERVAERFGFTSSDLAGLQDSPKREVRGALEDRVEDRLTERAATFQPGEFRAVLLEQSVGEMAPRDALKVAREMVAERRVLLLEGGVMTTMKVRAREQAIEQGFAQLVEPTGREVGDTAREIAMGEVAERLGARLSDEQEAALRVMTGAERAAILIGPAGTGKGVVIDAAVRAEQLAGREALGVSVSWSTAQRLGRDCMTVDGIYSADALLSRVERGRVDVGEHTTVFFDEAGMADTARLHRLTRMVNERGGKLVLIGDAAQLPSIGAGGMFERLIRLVPHAELSDVRRTLDPEEQEAWAELRAGRSDRAMAHYQSRGQLHMSDTRDEAAEQAVQMWARLTEEHPIEEIALISDASNQEIHRLNARAQHLRHRRGELGEQEAPVPGVHYTLRQGDRIALIEQHRPPGQDRVENGSQGQVLDITQDGRVLIEFDITQRQRTLDPDELGIVRLGYAQHIHRAQGATVTRTLVVTGGWQTSKEPAYVEASRPRQGTDWYVNREELGTEGRDRDRIVRLAEQMKESGAQTPSLAYSEIPAELSLELDQRLDQDFGINIYDTTDKLSPLPGLARMVYELATPPEQDRSR